jgi:hypothetical protein
MTGRVALAYRMGSPILGSRENVHPAFLRTEDVDLE